MKKLILGASLGLLLMVGNVSAASDLKVDLKNPIQRVQNGAAANREIRQETRKEKITRLAEQLVAKVTNTLANLEQLVKRVETRITKMETAGKDVAAAKAKMPAAQSAATEAKAAVENLIAQIPNIVNASSTPKEIRASLKTNFEQVKTKMKSAHQAVVEVISALKPAANSK